MRTVTSALALAGVLGALSPHAVGQDTAPQPAVDSARTDSGRSELRGHVSTLEGAPVGGAKIIIYHLSSETVFDKTTTDRGGSFSITGLPYGYFDIAVETAQGLFVADQVVNLPPSGKSVIHVTLAPGAVDEPAPRSFPGSSSTPAGVARVGEKPGAKAFWRSPKGLAIIGGAVGVGLLALALSGGSDEQPASPSQ